MLCRLEMLRCAVMSGRPMMTMPPYPAQLQLRRQLTRWYDRNKRALPWRETRDPYAIWVSEIMLQQTRVDTVIPYYRRFLHSYPTVRALADADLQAVLHSWSGLGYYRRARLLHRAAGEVLSEHGGVVPHTAQGLQALPGIGAYTAGAIASIACDEAVPIVDGNVIRILSRLYGVTGDMRRASPKKSIWALAETLVPRRRPGRFNQAMMELGAMICTPRTPSCGRCPVREHCVALAQDRVDLLPELGAKRPPREVHYVAAVVRRGDDDRQLLLAKRHDEGIFGGLWEPPMVPSGEAKLRELRRLGVRSRSLREVGHVAHVLTHRVFQVDVLAARAKVAWRLPTLRTGPYEKLAWRRAQDVPLSSLAKKLLKLAVVVLAAWGVSQAATAEARERVRAGGETQPADTASDGASDGVSEAEMALYRRLSQPRGGYARLLASLAVGRGVRFNNPYRLATQLGDTGESLSLAAPYVEGGIGVTFGRADGLGHGAALRLSAALDGVPQQAVGIGYLAVYRRDAPLMASARLGVSVLTAPDPNVGGELGLGLAWFLTGALGVHAELVGNLYYGAATYDVAYSVIPMLSGQAGITVDYEVLP
jgi:A/G-specific adenine glycosylase